MKDKCLIIQHQFLDRAEINWWIGENAEVWTLFVERGGKVWNSSITKQHLDTVVGSALMEGDINKARKAIALSLVGHIEAQMNWEKEGWDTKNKE